MTVVVHAVVRAGFEVRAALTLARTSPDGPHHSGDDEAVAVAALRAVAIAPS